MKMRKGSLTALVLGGAAMLAAAQARATPNSWVYSYVTNQSNYNATPGQTVTANVYLKETITSGTTSLINSDGGLYDAGYSVTQVGTLPSSPTELLSILGSTQNFPGGLFATNPNNSSTFMGEETAVSTSANSGPTLNVVDPNNSSLTDEIQVGTVTFTAGSSAGVTSFTLGNYKWNAALTGQTGNYTNTYNSFDNLDYNKSSAGITGANQAPETFSVTVTPEPGSLGLGLMGLSGLLIRRRNRKVLA